MQIPSNAIDFSSLHDSAMNIFPCVNSIALNESYASFSLLAKFERSGKGCSCLKSTIMSWFVQFVYSLLIPNLSNFKMQALLLYQRTWWCKCFIETDWGIPYFITFCFVPKTVIYCHHPGMGTPNFTSLFY